MTAIRAAVEILAEEPLDDADRRRFAAIVGAEARRLARLVEAIAGR